MNQEVNRVNETMNYDQFSIMIGNRDLDQLNLNRIIKSMSEEYLFSPIMVNEKNEIVDGQHRFEAAKSLGLPIRYIKVEGYNLRVVQKFNTNSKNWTTLDYLNSYCELGYSEYRKARLFQKQYPQFSISAVIALLSMGRPNDKAKKLTSNAFNSGMFKCIDYTFAAKTANEIVKLGTFTNLYKNRGFLLAYISVRKNKNFKPAIFHEKIKKYSFMLEPRTSVTGYKALFQEIYNYRNRNKVSIIY